jgi:hypothetical protein
MRVAAPPLAASLAVAACGRDGRRAATSSEVALALELGETAVGETAVVMSAGEVRSIAFVVVGAGDDPVSFAGELPAFARLEGSLLRGRRCRAGVRPGWTARDRPGHGVTCAISAPGATTVSAAVTRPIRRARASGAGRANRRWPAGCSRGWRRRAVRDARRSLFPGAGVSPMSKKLALVSALALGAIAPAVAAEMYAPLGAPAHGSGAIYAEVASPQRDGAEQPRPQEPKPSSGCDCGAKR